MSACCTGYTHAQLTATVTSDVRYHIRFEYGTSTSYGSVDAWEDPNFWYYSSGWSDSLMHLQPGTTYHARVVVTTGTGDVVDGHDIAFQTKPQTRPVLWEAHVSGDEDGGGHRDSGYAHFDAAFDSGFAPATIYPIWGTTPSLTQTGPTTMTTPDVAN